jgi:hypothetical protein
MHPVARGKSVSSQRLVLSGAAYFVCAFALTWHIYRTPGMNVDLLPYIENVALNETGNLASAHAKVYAEPLTPHLRGQDGEPLSGMLQHRAQDPYYSAKYLPYFAVKPLYVSTIGLLRKTGLSLTNSVAAVSALAFLGIAVVLWLHTRSLLSLLVLVLPEMIEIGQKNDPDGMSAFFLLLGLWVLFAKNKDWGILPLVVAVWVRPENAILALTVIAVLRYVGRLTWVQTAVLAFLTVGSMQLISQYGYGWKSLYQYTFIGGEPGDVAHFAAKDYIRALGSGMGVLLHSSFLVFALLWLVVVTRALRPGTRMILGLAGFYFAARMVIFPSYQTRFCGLLFASTGMAAIELLSTMQRHPVAMPLFKSRATAA